jgi:hypothetical protein
MRAPRKGQAAIFNLTRELGARPALSSAPLESPCVLAETMQFVTERMELEAA